MGRQFFVSGFKGDDAFVDHALEVKRGGVEREGWDQTGAEAQVVGGRGRVRQRDAAVGLDTEDIHFAGQRAVTRAEVPEIVGGKATGNILHVIDVYGDDGGYVGSREVRWEKVAEGKHVIGRNRRIFY